MINAPAATQTYGSRGGVAVDMIIIHVMEGTLDGTLAWFATPSTGKPLGKFPTSSAHYAIGKDGRVAQCVSEQAAAFHAGNSAFNRRSIGIELEGYTADFQMSKPMLDALVALVKQIASRHGIPLDHDHIIGHDEVPDPRPGSFQRGGLNHHKDPGPRFPWADFIEALRQ